MKRVLFLLFLATVLARDDFGTPYLLNRRLCTKWACINNKIGLPSNLPPREQYSRTLKGLLPESWHAAVDPALDGCYGNRSRAYTNACPGQALMHCAVEQLIERCPESSLRRDDACSPVTSLAGLNYMFSQGLYENLEANLPYEQRPAWFMRHYFSAKCCNLPELFSASVLAECGFTRVMSYFGHTPKVNVTISTTTERSNSGNTLKIVDLPQIDVNTPQDPLECCDMSGFIEPSWRAECDFRLNWDSQTRLAIAKPERPVTTTIPPTTTTVKPRLEVKVLPLPCNKNTCVFRKLNIVTESGAVDFDAFALLLNNLTNRHPDWSKAKARVVTKCLTHQKVLRDYDGECDINKVLACTIDGLSENCPHIKKRDPCKHLKPFDSPIDDIICQVSTSKYVKNRRLYCDVPSLVNHEVLLECGVNSISRLEYSLYSPPVKHTYTYPSSMCTTLTNSTSCILSKMGALNKYNFMDYFKMKTIIRLFTATHADWQALNDVYINALATMLMYRDQCSSPKKLLNLIDVMLMTCPLSKRNTTPKCNKIFNELTQTPLHQNTTHQQREQILHHYQQIFLLTHTTNVPKNQSHEEHLTRKVINKIYDFGLLGAGHVPPVRTIDVNPTVRPVKTLLPVYNVMYGRMSTGLNINSLHNNGVWRGGVGIGRGLRINETKLP